MRKIGIILIAALLTQGCDPKGGFQGVTAGSNKNSSNGSNGNIDNGTPDNGTPSGGDISQVNLKSTVESGPNSGALALDLDIANGYLVLRIPLASSALIGLPLTSIAIPSIPGASVQMVIDSSGRNAVVVQIPMNSFLKGISSGQVARLPNGDPLPAVPRGELPTVSVTLDAGKGTKLYLYIGSDQAAAFVETPKFDPFKSLNLSSIINQLVYPVRNSDKQITGYFGFIGSKSVYSGGFYLATNLPPAIVKILDDYFIH